ncbi:PadR family transcriptional regulator [Halorubrum salipaludis]|uniref:PadR family transcriptional regulator n=1 Tax=Halorubrum salipaludis TaxID=2032630 RepID=A0A2A2FHL8_9EURY|nr:PadR family transcriptional regulator [Halorubrum salipaludis]
MTSPHSECDTTPSVADLSAVHRDLLWVLAQTGPCQPHSLHYALTDYYSDGIDYSQTCDTLEELIEREFVATYDTTTYQLTESGRRALSTRQAWQAGTLTTSEEEPK